VQVTYTSAGHETLAAISEELLGTSSASVARDESPELSFVEGPVGRDTLALITDLARPIRSEQSTLDYGDRISNAPGAKTPSRVPAPPRPQSATLAEREAPLVIFEMLTFVVQGPAIASLSSEAVRRRFVEEHLLARLPSKDMAQVERIDVTPWTVQGTVVVRVWCKV